MHCHRILVSALFIDMSSLLPTFISKKYFYFHLYILHVYKVMLVDIKVMCHSSGRNPRHSHFHYFS